MDVACGNSRISILELVFQGCHFAFGSMISIPVIWLSGYAIRRCWIFDIHEWNGRQVARYPLANGRFFLFFNLILETVYI